MKIHLHLNIKILRKSRNLTQIQLSEILGKSHTIIVNYEKAKVTPPLDVLLQLTRLFDVSLDDLVLADLTKEEQKVQESMAGYEIEQDWKFIALQLGRDLQDIQQNVRKECPKLWAKLNIENYKNLK